MNLRAALAGGLALALAAPAAGQDLAAAFRHALQNDSRLAAAEAQRDAQLEKPAQARAGLLPRVNLSVGSSHYASSTRGFSDNGQVDAPPVRSTNVALALVQPLYNRGAMVALAQGGLQAELGEAQLQQARAELGNRLVQAWFDALAAQGQAELATRQRQLLQARLQELPAAADGERRDLEARLRRQQIDERVADRQHQARRLALSQMAGPLPERLPRPAVLEPGARAQARRLAEQATEQSPAIGVQRLQMDLAESQVAQSRAAHAPVVELTANYSNDRGFQMLPGGTIVGRSIGVQVQMPLFDGMATVSRTREALSLHDKARHELQAARSTAAQEAQTLVLDLEAALARTELCTEAAMGVDGLEARLEQLSNQHECERARSDAAASLLKLRLQTGHFTEAELPAWMAPAAR